MNRPSLSRSRVQSLHRELAGHVERGEMPGIVALVSRGGEVHLDTLGTIAIGSSSPMRSDTIFRIASLTKPVTAVAAMILVEECRIRLDDSIDRWLPELGGRRVLRTIASEIEDTVPAVRAITVRDLLTYRMGFGSVMAMPDTYPIQRLIREYQIGGDGPPRPALAPSRDEWLRRLGSLPLMAQPGERWMYQVSGDVLGVLIERVSGMSLGAFMRDRIFEPLGMRDTDFHVPDDKLDRLAGCYRFDPHAGALVTFDGVEGSAWRPPIPFESGGGGLVSTMNDCFAFNKMMLDKGRHGDAQIVSRASVELMTSDQLTAHQRLDAPVFFGDHGSWGLGLGVDIRRSEIYRTPGRFGWDGGLGTSAYVDPAEGMIGILLTPRCMDSPQPPKVFTDFWTLAYGAME